MPRMRKDCPLCEKKNLCKLSNHLADIHQLSSEERRVYLNNAKSSYADEEDHNIMPRSKRARMENFDEGNDANSSCADEEDIMPRSKRARMDNFDEGKSTSSDNGDIFDDDDEEAKEYNSEEEESSSEENKYSEEDGSEQESEDGDNQTSEDGEDDYSEEDGSEEESEEGDHQTSKDGEDYDPWQTLIHEGKLQLLDEFQENVEYLVNEGFSEVESKRHSFSALLPKLTKELEDVYIDRLIWMSHMKRDPTHQKIMQTRDNLIDEDFFDRDEALYSAVEKRKFLFKHLLEERQHFSDNESDTNE